MDLKKKWRDLAFKYKLMIMLYTLLLPFLISLGFLYYSLMLRNFQEELVSAYGGVASQVQSSIGFIQADMEDFSTYISINDTVNSILNEEETKSKQYNTGFSHQSLRFILDIYATNSHINALAIYSHKGHDPYFITSDTSVFKQELDSLFKTEIYRAALEANGAPVWHEMNVDDLPLFDRNLSDKVVLSRVIFNHTEVKPIGFLVIGIDSKYLQEMCNGSLRSTDDGIVVLHDGKPLVTAGVVPDDFINNVSKNPNTIEIDNGSIITKYSQEDKISVYYLLSDKAMKKRQRNLMAIAVSMILGLTIIMFPVASYVSKKLVFPLGELLQSMKKLEKGDFEQRVTFEANDEIGEAGRHYNRMVQNVKELIEENYIRKLHERESELMALQAQINPHFLYNTLDSIFWKAQEDGSKSAAKMTYDLSQIFRLSLNQGKKMTTVKREVDLLQHYMEIQKERFGSNLSVTVNMTDEAELGLIPTLIIQPFVENAIIHGIEKSPNGGDVIVLAWCENDDLNICISDTGKGMTEEQIKSLLNKRQRSSKNSLGGYAIYNVYERLKLTYSEEFSLEIDSKLDKGTKVNIKIPYKLKRNNDGEV